MKKTFTLALLVLFGFSSAQDKMSWFEEAKLGIFIHWGIYAVDGISESWSFYNGYLSHEDYMKQLGGFTAEKYQPKHWVKLISNSGAKYTVITSKHHDGFALWNSKHGNLNAFSSAKAQKDVLTPFVKAVRKSDLKLGMYFSLPDWSYEDYTHHTNKIKRYQIATDSLRWNRYLNYMNAQLNELSQSYTPDLWWFDGDWEHSSKEWRIDEIKTKLIAQNKNSIFNSRLNGKGDYETPEIGIPVMAPRSKHWELCVSINDSWGYQPNDNNYKTPMQVIDLFVDTLSKGGNLLLNIGPKADGSIADEQKNVLNELGGWIKKHQSAVYSTQRGIPYEHFYGPTTLSKDRKTLYLYLRDIPKDGNVVLKGISNKINRAYVVGQGAILNQQTICTVYWNKYPGLTYIEIPKESIDPYYTVIAVLLDDEIELYREFNSAVEQN
ncbi:MAG: alpha-L-fucosidase [Flavobacteriaceae bacterium]|nr:alpha-L-fucosidase [Flavobacteriaceae bacterium]